VAATAGKWWQEREDLGSPSHEEALRRLARTNRTATITIETVDDLTRTVEAFEPGAQAGDLDERFVDEAHRAQYERFLHEEHHGQYGSAKAPSPWALGKCVFESLVVAGVRPGHRLLDFACGALRFGQWLIPYLDEGNYFGVDAHLPSLEAAATYEIPLHELESKRPRLLWDADLSLSHFGLAFDWIVDYNGSRRVRPKRLRPAVFERFAAVLSEGGRLLTSPRPAVAVESLAEVGLVLSRRWEPVECPFILGRSPIRWLEFKKQARR
jgi:hypothetical protein